MRYEVGLAIQSGDIVWLNGPFPAGKFADITIFRRALKFFLRACGERAEADDGYRGEPLFVDLPTEGCFRRALRQHNKKQLVRSRHETVNARFKKFEVLNRAFRHDLGKHRYCFTAVAVVTQVGIHHGNMPLFQVRGYKTQTLHRN